MERHSPSIFETHSNQKSNNQNTERNKLAITELKIPLQPSPQKTETIHLSPRILENDSDGTQNTSTQETTNTSQKDTSPKFDSNKISPRNHDREIEEKSSDNIYEAAFYFLPFDTNDHTTETSNNYKDELPIHQKNQTTSHPLPKHLISKPLPPPPPEKNSNLKTETSNNYKQEPPIHQKNQTTSHPLPKHINSKAIAPPLPEKKKSYTSKTTFNPIPKHLLKFSKNENQTNIPYQNISKSYEMSTKSLPIFESEEDSGLDLDSLMKTLQDAEDILSDKPPISKSNKPPPPSTKKPIIIHRKIVRYNKILKPVPVPENFLHVVDNVGYTLDEPEEGLEFDEIEDLLQINDLDIFKFIYNDHYFEKPHKLYFVVEKNVKNLHCVAVSGLRSGLDSSHSILILSKTGYKHTKAILNFFLFTIN